MVKLGAGKGDYQVLHLVRNALQRDISDSAVSVFKLPFMNTL